MNTYSFTSEPILERHVWHTPLRDLQSGGKKDSNHVGTQTNVNTMGPWECCEGKSALWPRGEAFDYSGRLGKAP